MKKKSIFVSKNVSEIKEFQEFCHANNLSLTAKSLITFEATRLTFKKPFEVYFFSSKTGVDFFLKDHIIEANKKIACIGESTKKHLEKLGHYVDFFGTEASNPEKVTIELKKWLFDRKIGFVVSDISKKTISNFFSESQKEVVPFYKTIYKPIKFSQDFDFYVFTSPSNFESFVDENKIDNNSKIISWGKVTSKAIKKHNYLVDFELQKASMTELQTLIRSLL